MRVFLTGGTGLIGRRIVQRLVDRGDEPIILSRRSDEVRRHRSMRYVRVPQGDPTVRGDWEELVDGADAVINLAGENLFSHRWDEATKVKIRDSRVRATDGIVRAIASASKKPEVLVQASAIGFYGTHGDDELTESSPSGWDFLAKVCREWEDAAAPVADQGVRLATIRPGIVLAQGAGALGVMTPIFRWLPGGAAPVGGGGHGDLKLAKGQQWMSWIHLDDIVGLFLMAVDNREATGPINGTAPNPVRNAEFSQALAKAVHRPMLPVGPPDALIRLALGEIADVVTKGQRVLPTKAQALGYHFAYPDLDSALANLFAKPEPTPKPAPAPSHSHH